MVSLDEVCCRLYRHIVELFRIQEAYAGAIVEVRWEYVSVLYINTTNI